MKNYEKYADEIRKYKGDNFCKDFVVPYVLKLEKCGDITCNRCRMLQMLWMLEECKEPETDWSKVKVDTLILVRDSEDRGWIKRHFAEYKDGFVYAWRDGHTSWTTYGMPTAWKYAKLAESEEE